MDAPIVLPPRVLTLIAAKSSDGNSQVCGNFRTRLTRIFASCNFGKHPFCTSLGNDYPHDSQKSQCNENVIRMAASVY